MQGGSTYPVGRTRLLGALSVISAVLMVLAVGMGLFYAGMDTTQGQVQRLFYVHVASFFAGATVFTATVVAGIAYLRTQNPKWDRLAVSTVEVGLPLMTVTLLTGMAWARPIWNTWWTGDPRLNSMAVMWLLYAAYLTLRNAIESPERRMRFAAVYGILAFASVIYTFIIIRLRPDTLHPVVVGPTVTESEAKGAFGLKDPTMVTTLMVSLVSFMLMAATLTWHRVRMENIAERAQAIKARLLGVAGGD